MPHKANEPRRHKIPKARYRVENWAAYDAALLSAVEITFTEAGPAGTLVVIT
ncbi:hypothetical protein SAMN02982917_7015 [Azospirillum oryzae]|uniref:Uncharacterized protein n=1 Tax=Azospirillum oryzae TaxID=286727 RepID=A0A1X7HP59_9PROT|nr:hypothetical protein SAMN02982917_7015 [Azospirillum oryzae]